MLTPLSCILNLRFSFNTQTGVL
uniref:Uncharacterized protein n=1 Tax=Anguilla anguilla TaxID=7936 RepID=A0A0E9P6Y7_ANGAN